MKFAHLADCHIGAWRDPKLRELVLQSFIKTIERCIALHVDFVLIAGDLFNTALPSIDDLKIAVKQLQKLKSRHIPVYMIAGSHDYSPTGKTMIDVLEEVGLVSNVVKGEVHEGKLRLKVFEDPKTKVKIAGMLGRRGQLEKSYYESLDLAHLEHVEGFKIFLFHSAIRELMPKQFALIDALELSYYPKDWNYYAGGHIHIINHYSQPHYPHVVYPGPVYPASTSELLALTSGGFMLYDDGTITHEPIHLKNVVAITIDGMHKSPEEVETMLYDAIAKKEFLNTIVIVTISGVLRTGKPADIDLHKFFAQLHTQGAYTILKNTTKFEAAGFTPVHVDMQHTSTAEDSLIREHLGQVKITGITLDQEREFMKKLLESFSEEKHEGEKVYEYEARIKELGDKIFEL